MSRKLVAVLVAAGATAVAGCASTSFNTTWKAPGAGPLDIKTGDKVLAVVISPNESTRRGAEAALVSELDGRGLSAIPAYTVIPQDAVQDQKKAQPYIDKSGARWAVVMRATGKDQEISGSTGMYGPGWGGYGGFYGGFWGYGWGGAYSPGYLQTDTIVHVETLFYDLNTDKLVWAGQSSTMNPSQAEGMIRELVDESAKQMKKEGLIPAK